MLIRAVNQISVSGPFIESLSIEIAMIIRNERRKNCQNCCIFAHFRVIFQNSREDSTYCTQKWCFRMLIHCNLSPSHSTVTRIKDRNQLKPIKSLENHSWDNRAIISLRKKWKSRTLEPKFRQTTKILKSFDQKLKILTFKSKSYQKSGILNIFWPLNWKFWLKKPNFDHFFSWNLKILTLTTISDIKTKTLTIFSHLNWKCWPE